MEKHADYKNLSEDKKNSEMNQNPTIPIFLTRDVLNSKKNLSVKQAITSFCRAKGWKYTDLAREVGIAKQTLNHYMNGGWTAPIEIKVRIAKALGVDSSCIWDLEVKKW